MIQKISIYNFLLIEDMQVEFSPKFTVFTGESGSGKSLIFKALRFSLGAKIGKSYIGNWDKFAKVKLLCTLSNDLKSLLKSHSIPLLKNCTIEHNLYQDKRICTINGIKVSMKILKQVSESLVLDSQQGHQIKIQDSDYQDNYLHHLIKTSTLQAFEETLDQLLVLRKNKIEMQKILESEDENWLVHQITELEDQLSDENMIERLQILVDTNQKAQLVKKEWIDKQSSLQNIRKSLMQLRQVQSIPLEEILLELEGSIDAIEEVFQSKMNTNVQEQYEVEEAKTQLGKLNDLARKHKVRSKDLYSVLIGYKNTLEKLHIAQKDMNTIDQSIVDMEMRLETVSKKLEDEQIKQSLVLGQKITEQMVLMGMEQAIFKVDFIKVGYRIQPIFKIRSNPGQPFKSISECLSGGEMARLSILLTIYNNPYITLVLDEVDTGVSGITGNKIRDLLIQLSNRQQIFCISHLAQVASGGHAHFVLKKSIQDKVTTTYIEKVEGEERAKELSRLMCGRIDEDMINQARRFLRISESA